MQFQLPINSGESAWVHSDRYVGIELLFLPLSSRKKVGSLYGWGAGKVGSLDVWQIPCVDSQ